MVTLQILVLPFLVRVRVAQQNKREMLARFSLFYFAGLHPTFFNLVCKIGGLWLLSLAYSLRPDIVTCIISGALCRGGGRLSYVGRR